MAHFHVSLFPGFWRKLAPVILACAFYVGLVLGCYVYLRAEPESFSWMRGALDCSVSIVCLLRVALFPLLICAIAVYFSQFWLLGPVLLCKGFSYSLTMLAFSGAFGSSWLLRLLFMFSDLLITPLLVFFSLRYGSGSRRLRPLPAVCLLLAACLIAVADHRIISPILAVLDF